MSKPKTSLKEPTLDNRLFDDRGPTSERLARIGPNFVVSDTGVLNLRIHQSPIERAVSRGTISEQHGRAAQKFYHHWARSGSLSLATNWKAELSPGGASEHIPMARTEIEAFDRRQIRCAITAIHEAMDRCGMSNDAIKLMFLVVCDEVPFERAGQLVWHIGASAAGTLAVRYVRSALRVLTLEWGL